MPNNSFNPADITTNIALSNGNLTVTATGFNGGVRTLGHQGTGKCYWEYTFSNVTGNPSCGFAAQSATLAYNPPTGAAMVSNTGAVNVNGGAPAVLPGFSSGSVCCIALNLDTRLFWAKNGGTANPATGVGGIALSFVGAGVDAYGMVGMSFATNSVVVANFGDTAFVGAVPAGFASGFPGIVAAATSQARAMVLA